MSRDPHGGGPVRRAGADLEDARGAAILVHGRGATAEDILTLARELAVPDLAYLAPQAAGRTWYPQSFLAPRASNEPDLTSALDRLGALVGEVESGGIPVHRIGLLGFSQGACLTLEHAARHPRRYGAVIGFTGGLIGPPGMSFPFEGSLAGTPVFLGSGDPDPHVPWSRVEETRDVLTHLGARVEARRYPGMPHTVNRDELDAAARLLQQMVDPSSGGPEPPGRI